MPYFEKQGDDLRRLEVDERLKIVVERTETLITEGALFDLRDNQVFSEIGVVRRTSPRFEVKLEKHGTVPWEKHHPETAKLYNDTVLVNQESVTVKDLEIGQTIEVVYQAES